MDTISSIANAFSSGGIWMYAILAVQIISIAIIIERTFALYILRKKDQKRIARKFEGDIKQGQLENALNRSKRAGFRNPIGPVVEAGVQAAIDFGGRDEIQSKMDEVLLNENNRLETRTGFLAMLGNVGTLLGLLGTIVGLIQAFSSVGGTENAVEKAAMLTQGISMAMNTTAYGLIMAIPALIMYAVLQNRANQLSEDLNQGALRIFNLLSFNYEAVPKSTPRTRRSRRS
jgi:biopolymer transport protein ExbB/TolQ